MLESQVLTGIPKIIDNAEALLADAVLLYENQRYERAYSLFQLSIEEIAKAFSLLGIILFDDITSIEVQKKLKSSFSDHKYKSKKSIGIESILINLLKNINFEKYEELTIKSFQEYDIIDKLNDKKNHGLYTTFDGKEFKNPNELISFEDVRKIKSKASLRVNFGKMIITGVVKGFDKIKVRAKELDIDYSGVDREQVKEFVRIRKKYRLDSHNQEHSE